MIVGLFLAQRLQRIDLRAGMYHASIASPASRTEYWLLKQRKVNELLRQRKSFSDERICPSPRSSAIVPWRANRFEILGAESNPAEAFVKAIGAHSSGDGTRWRSLSECWR
jgi:hypothetical protein